MFNLPSISSSRNPDHQRCYPGYSSSRQLQDRASSPTCLVLTTVLPGEMLVTIDGAAVVVGDDDEVCELSDPPPLLPLGLPPPSYPTLSSVPVRYTVQYPLPPPKCKH